MKEFLKRFITRINIKTIGFLILCLVLITSLFKIWGADLTNNVLGIAVMILLLSLFSDLKEFNFWGLKGKKELELEALEGKKSYT